MSRKPAPVLSIDRPEEWAAVVSWMSRRFDEEERSPGAYVMSAPVCAVLDAMADSTSDDLDRAHKEVREAWRELKLAWVDAWERQYNSRRGKNADRVFGGLVKRTNEWLDEHFPTTDHNGSTERKRLLAAVRQQRLRETRKQERGHSTLHVTIASDLFAGLRGNDTVPESKRHDLVRAALRIVLASPDLLAQAKREAGVTP